MRFSWGRSCSRSLALPVLCRTHPAQRLFDAFVVLTVVVSVNRDEHLVAGMVLPMLGMDGLRRHAAVARQRGEQARPGALPDRQGQAPGRRRARIHPDRRGRQPPPVPRSSPTRTKDRASSTTANIESGGWGRIFGDPNTAHRLSIDRTVHHGRMTGFEGDSYRKTHALMQQPRNHRPDRPRHDKPAT